MANRDVAEAWEQYGAAVGQLSSALPRTCSAMSAIPSRRSRSRSCTQTTCRPASSGLGEPDVDPLARELAALQLNQAAAVDLTVAQYLASLEDQNASLEDQSLSSPEEAGRQVQLILDQAHTVLTTAPGDWPPSLQGGAPEGLAARARTRDNRIRRPNPHGCRRHREGGARQGPVELDAALRGPGSRHSARACLRPSRRSHDPPSAPRGPVRIARHTQACRSVRRHRPGCARSGQRLGHRSGGGSDEPAVDKWLRKLYRVDAIEQELAAKIKAAPDSTLSQMDRAAFEVDLLASKFHRHMQVMDTVAGLLRRTAPWLIPLVAPWGQIGPGLRLRRRHRLRCALGRRLPGPARDSRQGPLRPRARGADPR